MAAEKVGFGSHYRVVLNSGCTFESFGELKKIPTPGFYPSPIKLEYLGGARASVFLKRNKKKLKDNSKMSHKWGENICKNTYLIKVLYPECIKNS